MDIKTLEEEPIVVVQVCRAEPRLCCVGSSGGGLGSAGRLPACSQGSYKRDMQGTANRGGRESPSVPVLGGWPAWRRHPSPTPLPKSRCSSPASKSTAPATRSATWWMASRTKCTGALVTPPGDCLAPLPGLSRGPRIRRRRAAAAPATPPLAKRDQSPPPPPLPAVQRVLLLGAAAGEAGLRGRRRRLQPAALAAARDAHPRHAPPAVGPLPPCRQQGCTQHAACSTRPGGWPAARYPHGCRRLHPPWALRE